LLAILQTSKFTQPLSELCIRYKKVLVYAYKIDIKPIVLIIFVTARSHMSQQHRTSQPEQGSTFLLVLGLGLIMSLMGMGLMMQALKGSAIASGRKESGKATAITEAGIARTLTLLKQSYNAALLTRNYDPINPRTGRTYLGADGALNSGDEGASAVNEWTGYNPSTQPCYQQAGIGAPNMPTTGTIGTDGTYTLRAYRYNPTQQTGIVLVEGSHAGKSNAIAVTFSISPILDNFPGIATFNPTVDPLWPTGAVALRGRQVLGRKGNIYYHPLGSADPALTGSAAPGEANRLSFLNAVWATAAQDGAVGDTVAGKIVACPVRAYVPLGTPTTNLGIVTTSQTLTGIGGTAPTRFGVDQILLSNNDVLTVDTTNGPVEIIISIPAPPAPGIVLRHNAKILNIRTDGQTPRVGDLRILSRGDRLVQLHEQTCIQNAFLWLYVDELQLFTSGSGCPGGRNTNFEGVAWLEALQTSKNAATNRDVNYLPIFGTGTAPDTVVIPGVTSGIYVPDDVSSLIDLLQYADWPVMYQFSQIKSWSRQRL
jgi:hypothetical protein